MNRVQRPFHCKRCRMIHSDLVAQLLLFPASSPAFSVLAAKARIHTLYELKKHGHAQAETQQAIEVLIIKRLDRENENMVPGEIPKVSWKDLETYWLNSQEKEKTVAVLLIGDMPMTRMAMLAMDELLEKERHK